MQKYLPEMYESLMAIYKSVDSEQEEETINQQYELIDGISVDFGIMQKTRKAYVIKSEFQWDDIGSFSAMGRFFESYRGNSIKGKTFLEQSENCFIYGKEKLIIGFGIKDLIVVDAGDVLLVMDKNRDQEIKHLVNLLKEQHKYNDYL
ncbi:hypothetical protein [Clostridium botulinum]|nr:hypothetical protein [Clostridium botulinum]